METFLIILIATSIGIYHDTNKPTRYTLNMENGSKTHIMLQNNSYYACPILCETNHIHHAVVCKDEFAINQNQSVYHILKENQDNEGLFCSYMKILSMKKWTAKPSSDELPDVVSAAQDK